MHCIGLKVKARETRKYKILRELLLYTVFRKYNRRFFKASDLVAVQLPEQEKTSILKKAIEWIKEKTRNLSHKNQIEEPNNKKQKDNNIENNSR